MVAAGVAQRFRISLLVPEGRWSSDGRRIALGALTMGDEPIPLMVVGGPEGAQLVGRIDHVGRSDGGEWSGTGKFLPGGLAEEAAELIRSGDDGVGVEIELGAVDVSPEVEEAAALGDPGTEAGPGVQLTITRGRIRGAAMGPGYVPAFPGCRIELVEAG